MFACEQGGTNRDPNRFETDGYNTSNGARVVLTYAFMVPYRHKKDFKLFTTEYYASGDYGYQPMPANTPGKLTCSSFQAGDYYGYGIDWMAVGYIDLETFLANNS